MEPDNQILLVFRAFYRVHHDVFRAETEEAVSLDGSGAGPDRIIKVVCRLFRMAVSHIPCMWIQGIGKLMHALVLKIVRICGCLDQGQPQQVTLYIAAVF